MSNNKGSRFMGLVLTLGLTGMGLLFLAIVFDSSRSVNGPMPIFTMLLGAGTFAALMFGPLGKAISRMLESDTQVDDHLTMRVEDLEARIAELSMEQSRVGELEDRLEFAERLLAQPQSEPVREVNRGS
jgi:hypothetical protein